MKKVLPEMPRNRLMLAIVVHTEPIARMTGALGYNRVSNMQKQLYALSLLSDDGRIELLTHWHCAAARLINAIP